MPTRFRRDGDDPSPARIIVRKRSITIKIKCNNCDDNDDGLYRHWFDQGKVDLMCAFLGDNGSWLNESQKNVPIKKKGGMRDADPADLVDRMRGK